jgi:DNA-directed RNA polymerase specialized sigma subunit
MTKEQLQEIAGDPKAFLLRGRKAKELIAAKRERIEEWRRLAKSITVTLKEGGGIGPSGYKQSLIENAVCNIVDLEREIIAEIETLVSIERDIHSAIGELVTNDRYTAVMEMRYLNGYSWSKIGERLYYGEDWACRLHGAALQEIRRNAEIALNSAKRPC